jgi:hypothetical protein
MSQEIDLCEDSDASGEWPNTASAISPPLSRKRVRDNEGSSKDAHPRNENGSGSKTATGSAEFVVDLQLADEVEVSPHRKRRSVKNDAAGQCAQILKAPHATEKDVDSEDDAQVADHRELHEGSAAAASHPMNSDSEQTSPKLPSNASGRQLTISVWEDRLSELADYRNIHGHCNVYTSGNSKLATWVGRQRRQYRLLQEGKKSFMTLSRIQELESTGFEWDSHGAAWEDRLRELADYRKIHGHCNVPKDYSKNTKLATWAKTQRYQYKLHLEGKRSSMTLSRIQKLESLGFEWRVCVIAWEDRLSELADYRKIHGHCNVPHSYSDHINLYNWVAKQRTHYRLHVEGKTSPMTAFRIKALESLGFEWDIRISWENPLRELASYRKIHGHCYVPHNYSENTKLANWVTEQRKQYRLHREKKTTPMTTSRIQELESLGFEWKVYLSAWEDRLGELADYRKTNGHCNVPQNYSENFKLGEWVAKQRKKYRLHVEGKTSPMTTFRIQALESLGFEWGGLPHRRLGMPFERACRLS